MRLDFALFKFIEMIYKSSDFTGNNYTFALAVSNAPTIVLAEAKPCLQT
jgi:hypothetical protein